MNQKMIFPRVIGPGRPNDKVASTPHLLALRLDCRRGSAREAWVTARKPECSVRREPTSRRAGARPLLKVEALPKYLPKLRWTRCPTVRDVKSRAGQRNYSGLFWCATTRTTVTRVGPGQRPYGSGALRISPNK